MTRRPVLALLLAAGCAGARPGASGLGAAAPSGAARDGLDALVVRNDAAGAATALARAVARAPRDPWARMGEALLARRALDDAAETRALLALVDAAPAHALAVVALRRLADLAQTAPGRAREIDAALAPLLASGRLGGVAAYRARVARIAAAEGLGDADLAIRLRAENGSAPAWTLAGPFGAWAALDLGRAFPPEKGELPARVDGPLGAPPRETRTLPSPDGTAVLDGEPPDGGTYYLAADAALARGGRYLLTVGASAGVRVFLDGAPVLERRALEEHLPTLAQVPVAIPAGTHRVLVRLARGATRAAVHVALARADGAPSDATWRPAPDGAEPVPAARPPAAGAPVATAPALAAALEPGGRAVASLLAARDALDVDREGAKALLADALARDPGSALLHAARGDALGGDATLDDAIARSRAEAELRRALELDPGDGEARLEAAEILRATQRADDADALLAGLPETEARTPAGLVARARVALTRGLPERADALVAESLRAGASCDALALEYEQASHRDAVARADEAVRALAACRGGQERLAAHLRARGDARGAAAALAPVVRLRPAAIDSALDRAAALVAAGDVRSAAGDVEALAAIWPRSTRVWKRLADLRELAGDAAGARTARERALALDGADLRLRRDLALDDGPEVLAAEAIDARAAIRAYEAEKRRDDTSSALVLDAAAIELHRGGTATERIHQVVHVLDQEGVEQFGEIAVPPGAEVLALRTVKPDGRTVEPEGAAGDKGTVSLAGLEPGDYVDFEYLRGRGPGGHRGGAAGFAADPFFFQVAGTTLFRSTYTVLGPRGVGLEVDAHNMPAVAPVREGDRDVVRAERTRVPAIVPEPWSPPATELLPFLHVGVGGGLEAMAAGLANGLPERLRPTLEIRALAGEIRAAAGAGATTEALVRAAYARVQKLVLGQGASLGDTASEVLSRGRGSRVLLLDAVLRALGVRARVALVRPSTADAEAWRFPTLGLYDRVLLAVGVDGPSPVWLDTTLRQDPFGVLGSSLLDCEALLLPEPGEPLRVVRTPARTAVPGARDATVRIVLAKDGSAEVQGEDRYLGASAAAAKAAIEPLDGSRRRQAVEGLLARSFRGLALEDAAFEGEDDPEAPLVIRWKAKVPALARSSGDGLVLDAPVLASRLGARYVQRGSRTFPLQLATEERTRVRVELVPPPGLTVSASGSRDVATPFGRFSRVERVEGGALVREDRLDIPRARVPPERYPDFAAFAASVDQIQDAPVRIGR